MLLISLFFVWHLCCCCCIIVVCVMWKIYTHTRIHIAATHKYLASTTKPKMYFNFTTSAPASMSSDLKLTHQIAIAGIASDEEGMIRIVFYFFVFFLFFIIFFMISLNVAWDLSVSVFSWLFCFCFYFGVGYFISCFVLIFIGSLGFHNMHLWICHA